MEEIAGYPFLIIIIASSAFLSWPIYKGMEGNAAGMKPFRGWVLVLLSCVFMLVIVLFLWPINFAFEKFGLKEPTTLYLNFPIVLLFTYLLSLLVKKISKVLE